MGVLIRWLLETFILLIFQYLQSFVVSILAISEYAIFHKSPLTPISFISIVMHLLFEERSLTMKDNLDGQYFVNFRAFSSVMILKQIF